MPGSRYFVARLSSLCRQAVPYSGSPQEDRFSLSVGSGILKKTCRGGRTIDLSRSEDSTLGGLTHNGRTCLSQPAQGWGRATDLHCKSPSASVARHAVFFPYWCGSENNLGPKI